MLRLLLLFAFAIAPLVASAHDGHHAPSHDASTPAEKSVAPAIDRATVVTAAVGSHCPSGGQELCSCHGLSCTTPFQPVAVTDAPSRPLVRVAATSRVFHAAAPVVRSSALLRFPPRGPPIFS
jgi:hypothetical protein